MDKDEEVCSHCGSYCHERDELDKAEREIVRLQKLAAQPAQEPVAWITPDGEGFRIRFSAPTNDVPLGWDALYTTPPQRPWVGLTDEEIAQGNKESWVDKQAWQSAVWWAEAKLKQKNGFAEEKNT